MAYNDENNEFGGLPSTPAGQQPDQALTAGPPKPTPQGMTPNAAPPSPGQGLAQTNFPAAPLGWTPQPGQQWKGFPSYLDAVTGNMGRQLSDFGGALGRMFLPQPRPMYPQQPGQPPMQPMQQPMQQPGQPPMQPGQQPLGYSPMQPGQQPLGYNPVASQQPGNFLSQPQQPQQPMPLPQAQPLPGYDGATFADTSQDPALQAEFGNALYQDSGAKPLSRVTPSAQNMQAAQNLDASYRGLSTNQNAPDAEAQAAQDRVNAPRRPAQTDSFQRRLDRRNAKVGLDTVTRRHESKSRRKSRTASNKAIQNEMDAIEKRFAGEDKSAAAFDRGLMGRQTAKEQNKLARRGQDLQQRRGLADRKLRREESKRGQKPVAQYAAASEPTYTQDDMGGYTKTGARTRLYNKYTGEFKRQNKQPAKGEPVPVKSRGERDALPPNTPYIGPDGKLRKTSG